MDIIKPEVVINAVKKILPNWELVGYGSEIIEFQCCIEGKWRVLTIRSVSWNNSEKKATPCKWYVYWHQWMPSEEVVLVVNKVLNELQS